MPLGTGPGSSAVAIHGTIFLVSLSQTFRSRCLHSKLLYPPNHPTGISAPHCPLDTGKRDVSFESQASTTASFLKTWRVFPFWGDKTV